MPFQVLRLFTVTILCLVPVAATAATHMVIMSDGTQLVTDVFTPSSGGPAWPVILERTPYPRVNGSTWTSQGYAYVCQSVRGRYGSEGTFEPFAHEGWGEHQDGVDTIAWIREQPWCNGDIATYGGSATAITQNLLGATAQDLEFQIAQEGASDFDDHLSYQGGVFRKSLVEGWLQYGVATPAYAAVWKAQPPSATGYWAGYDAEARSAQVTAPGLHVGGWWDIFARGTVGNFMERQYHGGTGAKGNQKLLMRPTGHGGWGAQDLQFAPNYQDVGVTSYRRRFARFWFDIEDDGIMDEAPVTYYVVGDDSSFSGPGWEWRTAEKWPPFPPRTETYYLHQNGSLTSSAPSGASDSQSYQYDPDNPAPTHGGQNLLLPYGPYDQRTVSSRPDVLTFTTEPLTSPLETTGSFLVTLHVSSDAPDTDFTAKLVDVYPDGNPREILMLDSIQRAKYRNGDDTPAPPLQPADTIELTVDLGDISWIFNTGHRIGLQISSSNFPRFEINPNNGDDFPGASSNQIATNTIHMSAAHPSALLIPIRDPLADSDNDGLTDEYEYAVDRTCILCDPDDDTIPNHLDTDSDNDGVSDEDETTAGTDPYTPNTAADLPASTGLALILTTATAATATILHRANSSD